MPPSQLPLMTTNESVQQCTTIRGPFYVYGLTLTSACVNNHRAIRARDEITYRFPNLNRATVEVWDWIRSFTPHVIMDVITFSLDWSWYMLIKGAPGALLQDDVLTWKRFTHYWSFETADSHNKGPVLSTFYNTSVVGMNRLFRRGSKTPKLHVTGLYRGDHPMTSGFTSQRASNAKNVSIWWRHHEYSEST